jgi:putative transposase
LPEIEVELKHALGGNLPGIGVRFIQTPPRVAPSNIVSTLKSDSAVKLFTLFPGLKQQKFWGTDLCEASSTYYASIGGVSEEAVKNYIQNQKTKG